MSSIVNKGKFDEGFMAFAKDYGFRPRNCRVRSPETKGKVESKNRFISWLKPYEGEFRTKEELVAIIQHIEDKANKKPSATTLIAPILLYKKEKEYLHSLPSKDIRNSYIETLTPLKVSNESLVYYKKHKYSVPPKYVNKTIKVLEKDGYLHIHYKGKVIKSHKISNKIINYSKDDYIEALKTRINKSDDDIERIALENLKQLDKIGDI